MGSTSALIAAVAGASSPHWRSHPAPGGHATAALIWLLVVGCVWTLITALHSVHRLPRFRRGRHSGVGDEIARELQVLLTDPSLVGEARRRVMESRRHRSDPRRGPRDHGSGRPSSREQRDGGT